MQQLAPYGAYCMFVAIKSHFTKANYDYFDYNGKARRASKEKFEKRNDRPKFDQLARKFSPEDLRDYFVANMAADRLYVTDMLNDEATACFDAFRKRQQAFTYMTAGEVKQLLADASDLKRVFLCRNKQYSDLILSVLAGKTSIETFVVLIDLLWLTYTYDRALGIDDAIWSKLRFKANKLRPWLVYDKAKMRRTLMKQLMPIIFDDPPTCQDKNRI